MSPNRISRRTALSAGGVLVALGVVGASAFEFASDDDPPGADGFTAKTVPAGSDPLVLVDAEEAAHDDAAKAALRTLLAAGQFADVPDALVEAFDSDPQSTVDASSVGKLAFVGSDVAGNAGGAVVWADWSDDELRGVLGSVGRADVRTETYGDRTLYTTAGTSAAVLADEAFALGATAVVRDIVDAWHGDAEPVGGATLDSFERTPREANVRFSFDELRLACDRGGEGRPDAYDRITRVYGWVPSTGDGIRLRLRVESGTAGGEVATAVRNDLAAGGERDEAASEEGDAGLPRGAATGVTVGHDHDFVAVDYALDAAENAALVSDVVETTVCAVGRSS